MSCTNARAVLLSLLCVSVAGCTKKSTSLPALPQQPVKLAMDDLGITHVVAQNELDAFYGGGYAMARDRLFQMELTRREAYGTQAELYGPNSVSDDYGPRMFNFKALGAADYQLTLKNDPNTALLLQAWVAGVNARISEIASGKVPRPQGFRAQELDFLPDPWKPEDPLVIAKMIAWGLSGTLNQDLLVTVLQRLVPDTASRFPVVLPGFNSFIVPSRTVGPSAPPKQHGAPLHRRGPMPDLSRLAWHEAGLPRHSASNNWAVAGAFTDSGRSLLAGDPHQALHNPNVFWPVHLSGGAVDTFGFAFPGTAGIQLGMNEHVGWTATVSGADVTDVWDVVVSPDYSMASLGNDSVPIHTRTEQIRTRLPGQPPGSGPATAFVIHEIPGRGVFVPDEVLPIPKAFAADHELFMQWTGFAPTTEATAYTGMEHATDLSSWEAAARSIQVGGINFIAASASDIVVYSPVQLPDRGTPGSHPMPLRVLDGSDPSTFWTRGFLPDSKLPHVRDPVRGYLVSANNDPFGFTADGNVENDPWYYGSIYAKGQRAYRIEQVLQGWTTSGHKVTEADMEQLQADTHSVTADVVVPALTDAVAAVGTDASLAEWVGRTDLTTLAASIATWDRNYDKNSGGAVAFQGLIWFAAKRAFEAKVTPQLFSVVNGADASLFEAYLVRLLHGDLPDNAFFAPQGNRALLLQALDDTDAWLKSRFNTDDVSQLKWSDYHRADFGALLAPNWTVPPAVVSGGADTINVSGATFFDSSGMPLHDSLSSEGAAYRMVMNFAADGRAQATIDMPWGASGEPGDPHSADLEPGWEAVTHTPVPFRPDEVTARTVSSVTLPAAK